MELFGRVLMALLAAGSVVAMGGGGYVLVMVVTVRCSWWLLCVGAAVLSWRWLSSRLIFSQGSSPI